LKSSSPNEQAIGALSSLLAAVSFCEGESGPQQQPSDRHDAAIGRRRRKAKAAKAAAMSANPKPQPSHAEPTPTNPALAIAAAIKGTEQQAAQAAVTPNIAVRPSCSILFGLAVVAIGPTQSLK
jgi:hypothetical protein